jgi:16S rRNA processing protein RimM
MTKPRSDILDKASPFEIGIITKPQGLKGELRVYPTTDDPTRFGLLDEVTVCVPAKPDKIYSIESVRLQKNLVFLSLKGVNDRNAAEALVRGIIKIPSEKALPLSENEYYIRDLIGLTVYADTGEDLGMLSEVLTTGANDVYIIKKPGHKDLLLPAIKDCVKDVILTENKMTVHLMEGLLP